MQELYVVVHEENVPDGDPVKEGIRKIKEEKRFLEITYPNSVNLHPDMPPASPDLHVFVCGAFTGQCCTLQTYALRKAGHNVTFDRGICYDNHISLPFPFPGLVETVPEYFP